MGIVPAKGAAEDNTEGLDENGFDLRNLLSTRRKENRTR